MPTVRMSFSPNAAHVRTARLVGVAVARRAGLVDTTLDEVRLAVGEACSRAVALHRRHGLPDPVELEISSDDHEFVVRVRDRAPVQARAASSATSRPGVPGALLDLPVADDVAPFDAAVDEIDEFSEEDVAAGVALTLLSGLVEELAVRAAASGTGTEVAMSWSTGHPSKAARPPK